MTYRDKITANYLRQIMHYNSETGVMSWAVDRHPAKAGQVIKRVGPTGYLTVMINHRHYKVHILAWLYVTGEWPSKTVDHANCDPLDNRWVNLRLATLSQQAANRRPTPNVSGFKGVTWDKRKRRWRATGTVDNRKVWIGRFDTAEEAHVAYVEWAKTAFGEFARAS